MSRPGVLEVLHAIGSRSSFSCEALPADVVASVNAAGDRASDPIRDALGDVALPQPVAMICRQAGLTPPPPGKQLTIAHVDERLAAANIEREDRMKVKYALAELNLMQTTVPR